MISYAVSHSSLRVSFTHTHTTHIPHKHTHTHTHYPMSKLESKVTRINNRYAAELFVDKGC